MIIKKILLGIISTSCFFLFFIGLQVNGIISLDFNIMKLLPIIGVATLLSIFLIFYFSVKEIKSLSKKDIISISFLFIFLFPFILKGPFFIPPSDPIYHADNLWKVLNDYNKDESSLKLYKGNQNKILNKSIFVLLGILIQKDISENKYLLIFLFHFFNVVMLVLAAYFSSRIYGLNAKWSFFSTLTMVFFFGTNRFSFLSYYSLGGVFINIQIYWLLSSIVLKTVLLSKRRLKNTIEKHWRLILVFITIFPLYYDNHKQEVMFLFFLSLIVSFLFLWNRYHRIKKNWKMSGLVLLVVFLFLIYIPTLFFLNQNTLQNSKYIWSEEKFRLAALGNLGNIYFYGKIFEGRVMDTLGIVGLIPLFSFLFYFFFNIFFQTKKKVINNKKLIFFIPGLLPFTIFFIPILNLIWLIVIPLPEVYWRICYFSQFWITISFILMRIELSFRRFFLVWKV